LAYLATRIIESVVLIVGAIGVLTVAAFIEDPRVGSVDAAQVRALSALAAKGNDEAYQLGMVVLGTGSIPLCLLLLRSRLVPRFLAGCGLAGYAALALGALLEIAGIRAGLMLSIPGGLFELALATWLLARGFNADVHEPRRTSSVRESLPS